MIIEQHIEISATQEGLAADILQGATQLSKTAIKQTMSKGAVWFTRAASTQRIRRADKKLKQGDTLHLYYDEKVQAQVPPQAQLIIDEGDYSIWYKPYGMLCQGSKWGDHCTINRWAETHLVPQRPAFIVHRLDRAATGLIIIAHKKKIAAYFSALFQNREIEKTYQAVVHGQFLEYIKIDADIEGKKSVSHVTPLKYDSEQHQTLVSVSIETGRKHQIRRHLSEAGFPIVGDRLYGGSGVKETDENLCLTSCYLSFISPMDNTKKEYHLPSVLEARSLVRIISFTAPQH